MKSSAIVLLLVNVIFAEDYAKIEQGYMGEALQFMNKCGTKDIVLCFKERALHYVNKLPSNLIIGGALSIKQNEGGVDRSARVFNIPELPNEPRAREDAIDKILTDTILNYMSSHSIELKVPDVAMTEIKRSIEEARKKKKKNLMPLLLLFKLKASMLAAIALKVLAATAFKALIIAKIALTLTLIIWLKKLSESKHQSSTYEVVAHDDHGHYRSFGSDLAYRAHKGSASIINS